MRTDLDHLPPAKQRELERVVQILFEEFGEATALATQDWKKKGRILKIEFPPTLAQAEAPPLFVRGEGGRAELVNYRLRGRYYVVDRLFEVAELRLGERRQQVVRIVRGAARPRRRSS